MTTNQKHRYVPNVTETRKQNKGIWTCIDCGENIIMELKW